MADRRYDVIVIVIGTGGGGGTLTHRLAPSGKRILLLERGGYVPREKANWDSLAVVVENRYHVKAAWLDKDGRGFRSPARISASPACGRRPDRASSSWSTCRPVTGGRSRRMSAPTTSCAGRRGSRPRTAASRRSRAGTPSRSRNASSGSPAGVTVRDPDGHALEVVEP